MPTIFSPVVNTRRSSVGTERRQSSSKKRKRVNTTGQTREEQEQDELKVTNHTERSITELEYAAVVSPPERLQRRVAGQPLDQLPPGVPFPHAQIPSSNRRRGDTLRSEKKKQSPNDSSDALGSLHLQHLAALTAIVHRSLLKEDFPRASRALGLMFREDMVMKSAAVRNRGFMGIAAEVLLRQGCPSEAGPESRTVAFPFTREGFENAKRFYERLIIRHPYHKSWPDSVNAIDFYLAIFNIWIYVVHAENTTHGAIAGDVDSDAESATSSDHVIRKYAQPRSKVRELEQAKEIASRIEACTASMPYSDEPELNRLRENVKLWITDLQAELARNASPLDGSRSEPETKTK
ncbi:uncharacterized protein Z518_08283 [Rhinocladiella mackenziei CBS 650.93]|uniref:Uncharacterized protein n=1 Tax=Rhinocladiella mackenziei CBS 650.93 TaxID=1442369 RepID=A0A0D2FK39_9EURO|nr:uncharacterized protein Z518_08283 [Rhinocladiella mackenziei CBS 650.93]KIX02342.1 hypothetical protein Z518_08283 [Rhinocladiella mackenziei CBS 650.93]